MALQELLLQWFEDQKGGSLFLPIILSLVFSFLFFLLWSFKSSSLKLPPSPPKLPIIGNFHQLGTLPHRTLRDLANKYGPLMLLHLGSSPTLVVSSPEMAKEITKTHDLVFANRPATKGAKTLLYNCTDVGFAPYGEYWRAVRKICVVELLSAKRVQSFEVVREEEIRFLMENITRLCSSTTSSTVNLTELLLNLANNLISRVAFGKKYDEEGGNSRLGHLTRDVLTLMGAFSVGDYFPSFGWVDILTGLTGKMNKTHKDMDAFFDQVIEDHLTNHKNGTTQADHETVIDILLHAQKDKTLSITLARDNIKAIVLDLFVAGTDTVSVVVEWAMVELMRHPEMMKKAQEEVRGVVGKKSKVDEDDTHHMEYLKCIVKEILRLHPPVPLLVPRFSSEEVKVEGYHIPAKTKVFVNAWAIQRDPKSWKLDPEEFIPERFINNPIDYKGQDFEYLPFGAGRRGCPGMQFGVIASELLLANLLFWFDWDFPAGSNKESLDITDAFGLTVYKKNPTFLVPSLHFS